MVWTDDKTGAWQGLVINVRSSHRTSLHVCAADDQQIAEGCLLIPKADPSIPQSANGCKGSGCIVLRQCSLLELCKQICRACSQVGDHDRWLCMLVFSWLAFLTWVVCQHKHSNIQTQTTIFCLRRSLSIAYFASAYLHSSVEPCGVWQAILLIGISDLLGNRCTIW